MHLLVPPGGRFPETRRIDLDARVLTIGRGEGCDVRVDVPGVDGEHAKISEVALIAIGSDCAVGDIPLDPGCRRLVMPGDEIQIGSVVVALEGDDPSIFPPPPDAPANKTPSGRTKVRSPRVRVVEGANFGDELLLDQENREYVLGRNAKCDLVLEDREVSREHLKLVRRGYNVFIQDQSSTRGSWLGRSAVYSGSTLEWSRPRMLKVGATVLSLELPDSAPRRSALAQVSAPMTPTPRPAKAPSSRPPKSADPVIPSSAHVSPMPASAPLPVVAPATTDASSEPPAAPGTRRAWKKQGPTFGRATGLVLLAVASLAILGAIFVVFSLME